MNAAGATGRPRGGTRQGTVLADAEEWFAWGRWRDDPGAQRVDGETDNELRLAGTGLAEAGLARLRD